MNNTDKIKYIQEVLGVTADGMFGAKSRAALEALLKSPIDAKPAASTEGGTYSERFLKMIPFLWEWEGTKFENDPDDPGGATKYGIDQRSHPNEKIRNLTEARAIRIYWDEYWQKYDCENYAYPLGEVVFNCCVNAGWGRAKKIFDAGGNTAARFLDEMDKFYRNLAAQGPHRRKFLKGWLNRTNALRKHLGIT
jgi:lysozyme family protein